jgi:hypothetical protein
MKNRKIFLLPASLLLLTACSGVNTSIPKEYTPVDVTNTQERDNFFAKVADNIGSTYAKATEGFTVSGSVSFKEISYSEGTVEKGNYQYVKINDFGFSYSVSLIGLNEGAAKAKAAVKVDNFGFKLDAKIKDKNYSLKASDVDAACYVDEGNFYYDLSDKDIKTFAYDAIEFAAAMDKDTTVDEVAKSKEEVNKYCGKYVVKGVASAADAVVSPKLEDAQLLQIQKSLKSIFTEILSNEKSKDMITLANDPNTKGCAIGLGLTSEGTTGLDKQTDTLTGDLAASLVFDKEGYFSRFGFAGNALYKSNDDENAILNISKVSISASVKYGNKSVKLPSFSDYKELEIPTKSAK